MNTTATVDFSDIPFHSFDIDAESLAALQSRVRKSCACGMPADYSDFAVCGPICRECLTDGVNSEVGYSLVASEYGATVLVDGEVIQEFIAI